MPFLPFRLFRCRRVTCLRPILTVGLLVLISAAPSIGQQPVASLESVPRGSLPINFEPNQGQAEPTARFVTRTANLTMALRERGVDLLMTNGIKSSRLAMTFVGASPGVDLAALNEQPSYSNYLLGSDSSKWLAHVPHYGRVSYRGVYPGIDAVFYGNGMQLEHDFVVASGADYHKIRLGLDGPAHLKLRQDGGLRLLFPEGELVLRKPQVYQICNGSRIARQGRFVVFGNRELGFAVGNYDRTKPLIIDPVLVYSTYLADLSVVMSGVATDSAGDTYLTGITFSPNFPTTPGAFEATCAPCASSTATVFVTKINSTGTALVFSTFLGGSNYNQPFGIAVDATGNVIVAGTTQSTDFPKKNPIPVGTNGNGSSYGFISSLTADGSALNYSSVLGGGAQPGQSSTTNVGALALDSQGNAYVTGITDSPVFPTTSGAMNSGTPSYPENIGFVSKFLTNGALGYSALLGNMSPQNGGGGPIGIFGIAVDSSGSAFITGSAGTLWPTTTGAFQTTIPGATPYAAPFITKLAPDASSPVYSTFLGDGGYSTGITIVPGPNEAFITGFYSGGAAGNNFPTTPNAFEPSIGNYCCASFFTQLNADGSSLVYSSYFSSIPSPVSSFTNTTGIAVDGAGDIWLAGQTHGSQFNLVAPLQSLPASPAIGPTAPTIFVSRFDPTGKTLLFSSFFGGVVQGGNLAGIAIDPNNHAHIAGTTGSGLFVTPNAYLSAVTAPPPNVQYTYGFAAVIDADTPAPSLCFNPQGMQFGYTPINVASTQSLTITNCGNAPLTVTSFQSSDPHFSIPSASNGCQQSIAANASCSVSIIFTPTAVGVVSSALTITSNAPVSTTFLSLQGLGAVPQINAFPSTSVVFDPQFIGQTSPQQFVEISNSGGVPLTINLSQTTITGNFAFTQTGCNQPLYQGQNCACLLTFTPQTAGTLSGTLNIASNDPNTPVLTINLTGVGYSSYPVPTVTAVLNPTLQAGSTPVSLTIYGTNFFPASMVQVSGVPQSTTYQNSGVLTANLDPSLVANIGELQLSVANPTPGGGATAPVTLTIFQSIALTAQKLIYEPFSGHLFASVPALAANNPNTVAVIDPVAAQVTQYISVGNNPNQLAVSDDGQYLYVALDGDHSIQRVNLSTMAIEQTFALPVDSSFGKLTVADMKVVPGSPQSVVVALFRVASPAEDGIALYNGSGLVNWLANSFADGYVTVDSFAFAGTPPVLYSLPTAVSGGGFGVFTIGSSGIQAQSTGSAGTTNQTTGSLLASDLTLLYTNSGEVWSPPSTLLGTYNPALFYASSVVPDDSMERTFFLNQFSTYSQYQATSVDAYDQKTFQQVGTVPFLAPVYGPDAVALARWGADGFAFVVDQFVQTAGSGQVILFRSSIAYPSPSTNPVPVISALSTTSVAAGSPAFVLGVQGAGFVPGATVQWNGSVRATTFLSSTQLKANISSADVAQPGTVQVTVVNPAPGGGTSGSSPLTVVPFPAAVGLQPGTVTFASQTIGTQSSPQTVTLQNTGQSTLTISGIQISGVFTQTSNCPSSLSPLATCVINVTFAPTAAGAAQGSLTVTDNAPNSPQSVTLFGTAANPVFNFGTGGATTTTATVSSGQSATYNLSIVSGVSSSGTVNLTCTQVPPNATCALSSSSLTLTAGSTATFTVTVNTGGAQSSSLIMPFSITAAFSLVGVFLLPFSRARRNSRSAIYAFCRLLPLLTAVLVLLAAAACGGGTGSAPPPPPSTTTPAGSYTLQVVATQGATSHTQSLTLVVQ